MKAKGSSPCYVMLWVTITINDFNKLHLTLEISLCANQKHDCHLVLQQILL